MERAFGESYRLEGQGIVSMWALWVYAYGAEQIRERGKKYMFELRSLLEYFRTHGVSHDPARDLEKTIRFQDIIGTSTHQELFEAYEELEQQERRTFLFAVCAALSPEMAEEVIKQTTIRVLRRALMADFEEETKGEWSKLSEEQVKLREARKGFYKRLAYQKERIAELENRLKQARITSQFWCDKARDAQYAGKDDRRDAAKFRQLRDLLSGAYGYEEE